MSSALTVESTLTSRYQTTIPELVRKTLSLGKHDKVHYEVKPDGAVVMTRASTAENRSIALNSEHETAEHDAWFRSKVADALAIADSEKAIWLSNEDIKKHSAQKRQEWRSLSLSMTDTPL